MFRRRHLHMMITVRIFYGICRAGNESSAGSLFVTGFCYENNCNPEFTKYLYFHLPGRYIFGLNYIGIAAIYIMVIKI
jgi:hypothetical protein